MYISIVQYMKYKTSNIKYEQSLPLLLYESKIINLAPNLSREEITDLYYIYSPISLSLDQECVFVLPVLCTWV